MGAMCEAERPETRILWSCWQSLAGVRLVEDVGGELARTCLLHIGGISTSTWNKDFFFFSREEGHGS